MRKKIPIAYIEFGWSWKTPFDDLDYITQAIKLEPSVVLKPRGDPVHFSRDFYCWTYKTIPLRKGHLFDQELEKFYTTFKDKKAVILDIQEKIQEKALFCCVLECRSMWVKPHFLLESKIIKFLAEIEATCKIDWI